MWAADGSELHKNWKKCKQLRKKVNMLSTKMFIFLQTRYKNGLRHSNQMRHLILVKLTSTRDFDIYWPI